MRSMHPNISKGSHAHNLSARNSGICIWTTVTMTTLLILLFLCFVSTTVATITEAAVDTTTIKDSEPQCILPPYPNHGVYNASPGDRVDSTTFNVTCFEGYSLVGAGRISCISGKWDHEMPECLPLCKAGKRPGVISCEPNVPECVVAAANPVQSSPANTTESPIKDLASVLGVVSGGYKAREASWHAGLYMKTTNPYKIICGSTIITKKVVLTAAHCFSVDRQIPPATDYAVAAGKLHRPWNDPHDTGAQKRNVVSLHIPPRYQGSLANFQHDIALAVLDEEFEFNVFVSPACVSFDPEFDEEQLQEGKTGKVLGWGLTGSNAQLSYALQTATLPNVPIEKCIEQSPVGFKSSITGDKICAGYNNGTAVCRGDSGGGLVFVKGSIRQRHHFLRGVVSTSPTTMDACNIYTWATFTHVLRHERFIKSVVPDVEDSCDRATLLSQTSYHTEGVRKCSNCPCACP